MYPHVVDIYPYVGGSTDKRTDTTKLPTWNRNDNTAKAAIISFLSQDYIYLARDAPTGKDTWK